MTKASTTNRNDGRIRQSRLFRGRAASCFVAAALLACIFRIDIVHAQESGANGTDDHSNRKFVLTRNTQPELCEPLLQELEDAAGKIHSLCEFPNDEWNLDVSRPNWKAVDPSSVIEELRTSLPFVGFETSQLRKELRKANPAASGQTIADMIWTTYGPGMLAALRKSPEDFMESTVDVDNDGINEKVYRVTVLKRENTNSNSEAVTWVPEICPPSSPAHAIIFEQSSRTRMGTLAYHNTMDHQDLIYIRGRTYSVWTSQRDIAIYEHVGAEAGTLFQRGVCSISAKGFTN